MKCVRWGVFILFVLSCCALFLPVSVTINAQGLRNDFDTLATPLHKTPFMWLANVGAMMGLRKPDLAVLVAVAFLVFVFVSAHFNLRLLLTGTAGLPARINDHQAGLVIRIVGGVLLLADSAIFFRGVQNSTWATKTSNIPIALVATLAYAGALIVIAFVSVLLEPHGEKS